MALPAFSQLVLLLLILGTAVQCSDTPVLPLCGRISGFAGDINNKVRILIDRPVAIDQAIIVAARPVPFDPAKSSFADHVDINATFESKGQTFFATSDKYGVVFIADKDFTGDIRVVVRNRLEDESAPFELYSYLMNMRECSIEFSPTKPFIGPVPTHLPPQELKSASFYLVAHPPQGVESFIFTLYGSSATVYYSASQTERGVVIVSGKAFPCAGGDIFFTLVSKDDVVVTEMVRATINYQMSFTPNPLPPPPQPQPQPAQPNSPPNPAQPNGPVVNAPQSTTVAPSMAYKAEEVASSWSGFGLFVVAVLAYFSVRTMYNYRFQGITKFPEYIPHHEALASVGACIGALALHAKNKGRQVAFTRSGYNAVNRQDIYDTNE